MQLVSFNSQEEGISETQLILQQPAHALGSKESISSFEIRAVHAIYLDGEDSQRFDDEEHCNLVNDDRPQCRICLDIGGEDFIAPCHCRGTQKYVHRSCLDHWRSTKEGRAFSHCTECKAVFILRANVPPDRRWLRFKFKLLVVRDLAFIFVIVQLGYLSIERNSGNGTRRLVELFSRKFVVFLGAVVYKFYGDELHEMFGYEEHPFGFYAIAVLAIILVGLLYGFFIAIICGQRINERHYHVLAKQELTKEYVVESREDNKNQSQLDPSHIAELRMLELY